MDGMDSTPATGASEGGMGSQPVHNHAAAAEAYFDAPQQNEGTAPVEAATGSDTPGEEQQPAFVPSHVLRERTEKHREQVQQLEEQLRQYDAIKPYQELAQTLAQANLQPEQVLAQLLGTQQQAPPTAADPEAQFTNWATEQGYDVYSFSDVEYRAAQREWKADQFIQKLEAREQAAQQAEAQAQVQAEVNSALQAFPALKDPDAQPLFLAMASQGLQAGVPVQAVAEKFNQFLERREREALARYSAGKGADSAVPVVAGGSAPAPVQRQNYHTLSPSQRSDLFDNYLSAAQTPQ